MHDGEIAFPLADVASPALRCRAARPADAVRADQSRRGVAEQALAGGALRRARLVPARRPRAALGRALGAGRRGAGGAVVAALGAAARVLAPATRIADLVALARAAALIVSGDTGPLHIAAAVGTPIVGVFGPTDPARNGPWSRDDVVGLAIRRVRVPLRAPVPRSRVVPRRRDGRRGVRRGRSGGWQRSAQRESGSATISMLTRCAALARLPRAARVSCSARRRCGSRRRRRALAGGRRRRRARPAKRFASGRPGISRRAAR